MTWLATDTDDIHIVPVNDLIEHDEHEDDCICGPTWERYKGVNIYSHNSLDGRERYE